MSKLFISDLHLNPHQPELTQLACDFLYSQRDHISELYILGDIFNTWLGDDLVPKAFQPFVHTLQSLASQQINIFLMVGNRDFMLGTRFAKEVGAKLITEPYRIKFAGYPTLLLHGDSLCTDDVSYQRYRRWVRNRFLQWCFLRLPANFRQHISDKIKEKSRQQKQHKTTMIMDVNQSAVEQSMTAEHCSLLIHGHTHRPAIHRLTLADKLAYRVVLGDWHHHASYLLIDDYRLTLYDYRLQGGKQELDMTAFEQID